MKLCLMGRFDESGPGNLAVTTSFKHLEARLSCATVSGATLVGPEIQEDVGQIEDAVRRPVVANPHDFSSQLSNRRVVHP